LCNPANEDRIVVPQERFLAQQCFATFTLDLHDNYLASIKLRWSGGDASDKMLTPLIKTLQHTKFDVYLDIHTGVKVLLTLPLQTPLQPSSDENPPSIKTR
jgi:hypothetical protein